MKRYVGLDVSQDECAVCILNEDGTVMFQGSCPTDPDSILQTVSEYGHAVEKIVHESGPLSI